MELSGHAHTVWRARHNPFYDQLLLSCSSDATVGLWYTPSVAAAAAAARPGAGAGPASPVSSGKPRGDGRVKSFADHEESVYGALQACVVLFATRCTMTSLCGSAACVASFYKLDAWLYWRCCKDGFCRTLQFKVARLTKLLHARRCGMELGGAVGVRLCFV